MTAWTYMLRCRDGAYYVGVTTTPLERRLAEHNAGAFDGWTAARRPVEIVRSEAFTQVMEAAEAERRIKGWSRAKKEALIAGDFNRLHELSRYKKKSKRSDKSA